MSSRNERLLSPEKLGRALPQRKTSELFRKLHKHAINKDRFRMTGSQFSCSQEEPLCQPRSPVPSTSAPSLTNSQRLENVRNSGLPPCFPFMREKSVTSQNRHTDKIAVHYDDLMRSANAIGRHLDDLRNPTERLRNMIDRQTAEIHELQVWNTASFSIRRLPR